MQRLCPSLWQTTNLTFTMVEGHTSSKQAFLKQKNEAHRCAGQC